MKILIIGDDKRYDELRIALKDHDNTRSDGASDEDYQDFEVIIDANFDDDPSNIELYAKLKNKIVIVCGVKIQLSEIKYHLNEKIKCILIGANLLPTFINRSRWEVSLLNGWDRETAMKTFEQLGVTIDFIEDRVGMITPRVVFMIINEACYTLQERTANISDIDHAMKLGTNYPYGPFEWADKIGVTDVFETLSAIYEDTKDERYKICPLLKTKYLKNETFYR